MAEIALIQPFTRGFGGKLFSLMMQTDPASGAGRYNDLCGLDIGRVMAKLDWYFSAAPVSVTLTNIDGQPMAIGFCAPIILNEAPSRQQQFCGINLSYAVHSEFEGRGYGLAASCLAIQGAASLWSDKLKADAFLNIQTRAENVRSNSLIRHLCGNAPFQEPAFSVQLSPQLKPKEVLQYSGARFSWSAALSNAEAHLLNMPFLNEIEAEDETENDLELAPAG